MKLYLLLKPDMPGKGSCSLTASIKGLRLGPTFSLSVEESEENAATRAATFPEGLLLTFTGECMAVDFVELGEEVERYNESPLSNSLFNSWERSADSFDCM